MCGMSWFIRFLFQLIEAKKGLQYNMGESKGSFCARPTGDPWTILHAPKAKKNFTSNDDRVKVITAKKCFNADLRRDFILYGDKIYTLGKNTC